MRMTKNLTKFLLFAMFFIINSVASNAHDLGVVRMELIEKELFNYSLLVKLPIETQIETPNLKLPIGFDFTEKPFSVIKGSYSLTYYKFKGERFLTNTDILILPWQLDGGFIEANWLDGTVKTILIKEGESGIPIDVKQLKTQKQSSLSQIKNYTFLGIEHILFGWDHLAFVLALCLVSQSNKQLLKLVTAFTIGHSITLALAVLGIVSIAVPPVEACIALSIALVANAVFKGNNESFNGIWLVVGFGLLHGLGFASVLSEIGIEKSELLIGLISFNIGVEIGQIIFVLFAMSSLHLLIKQLPKYVFKTKKILAFSLGVLAFFWFFERIQMFYD